MIIERAKLAEMFKNIEDPRIDRTKKHPLPIIISIGFLRVLSGIDSFVGLQDYAEINQDWLSKIIDLSSGIPSHDTIGNVFSRIKNNLLTALLIEKTGKLLV